MILLEVLLLDETDDPMVCQGTEDEWCPDIATWQVECPEPAYGLGLVRFVCTSHMRMIRSLSEEMVSAL